MMLQLNPPIELDTEPHGRGWAHFVIDYGPEHDLLWTVFINATGECWTVNNRFVRLPDNISLGHVRK